MNEHAGGAHKKRKEHYDGNLTSLHCQHVGRLSGLAARTYLGVMAAVKLLVLDHAAPTPHVQFCSLI